MKNLYLLTLLSFFLINPAYSTTNMHALLIGISTYQSDSGWSNLSSVNDVDMINKTLENRGFNKENIYTLKNEEATYHGIIDAIDALIERSRNGDLVVFHFSGHGQQIMDQASGDELDGYDEAIVPYDSPAQFKEGIYEGERLIIDDLLARLFTQLRSKLGSKGQLLVILDSCHSGTGTRGYNIVRGTSLKMASETYINKNKNSTIDENVFLIQEEKPTKNTSPMIAFFGSGANELNYEIRVADGMGCGPLSYAFSQAFSQINERSTYRTLFEKIQLSMASRSLRQRPQAEGELDRMILKGQVASIPKYFVVEDQLNEEQARIEGGLLAGLYPGTTLKICLPQGQNTQVVAFGTVEHSEIAHSFLRLDTIFNNTKTQGLHAYIEKQGFGGITVNVLLNEQSPHPFWKLIREEISKNEAIKIVSEQPDMILEIISQNKELFFKTSTKDGQLLFKESLTELDADSFFAEWVIEDIFEHLRADFLRKLETPESELKAILEIIPLNKDFLHHSASTSLSINKDSIKFKVTNQSEIPVYFTILDIWPNDTLEALIPSVHNKQEWAPSDYFIHPGKSLTIPQVYSFVPPTGLEVFKLFVSDQPMDIRRIVESRGEERSFHNPHMIDDLFPWVYNSNSRMSRGENAPAFSPSFISVSTLIFELIE